MNLFCFASRSETNIWLGVRAKKWAVATVSFSAMVARISKAEKYLNVGDLGILYCNPSHSFTTPFFVRSKADPVAVVSNIWPEPWRLPFDIEPLGDPSKQLHMSDAWKKWPVLQNNPLKSISAAMNITGTTVFVPKRISEDDWNMILEDIGP
jgi:hypothetical protein